jgi:hypothetical protein
MMKFFSEVNAQNNASQLSKTAKLRQLVRNEGGMKAGRVVIRTACQYGRRTCQRIEKWVIGRSFDWFYGVDTYGLIPLGRLDITSDNLVHGNLYGPVVPRIFNSMMSELHIPDREFVFVDYGSGKGRALLLAAWHPFKRILGVEFSKELHDVAVKNVATFRRTAGVGTNVECVWSDAAKFRLPDDPVVLYMYNPFGEAVMQGVIDSLCHSWHAHPRTIVVLYRNPTCGHLFERTPLFSPVSRTQHYSIYTTPSHAQLAHAG